jgi:indolepyruvate ferredoxin oxidoreductase beta subunit
MSSNIIKIAVLAVGGQGGGVLSNWIVDLAEQHGYHAQSTSVPGVAQRTGATIYYVEIAPASAQPPILALMPTPGDVDIVIAAEAMEAGRAITRGIITPDKTHLITSNHRIYAVAEKAVPGDGRLPVEPVMAALQEASHQLVEFDMQATALTHGSHISAAMFGALAGANCLPFDRAAFEATIERSGRGVQPSLACFAAAFDQAQGSATDSAATEQLESVTIPKAKQAQWQQLQQQVQAFPAPLQARLTLAVQRLAAYQDIAYAGEYLQLVQQSLDAENALDTDKQLAFTSAVAEQLVNAMCYADVIHVAANKTQAQRLNSIRTEKNIQATEVMQINEYLHPRVEEICGLMPTRLGRWAQANDTMNKLIGRLFNKGIKLKSQGLKGFISLYMLAGLKPYRRRLWRHQEALQHWQQWLQLSTDMLNQDYELALAIVDSQRLIKGYGNTYERSLSNYQRLLDTLPQLQQRADGATCLQHLLSALLADAKGQKFEQEKHKLLAQDATGIPLASA